MNKYKITSLTLGLLLSTTAFAEPFDGFYVGAGAGWIKGNVDQSVKQTLTLPVVGTQTLHTPSANTDDNSWLGSVNFGFGKTFNQVFYLGLDAAAQFENIDSGFATSYLTSNGESSSINGSSKLDNELALTFMPGFVIKQKTLVYGKVGPTWGHFNNQIHNNYTTLSSTGYTTGGLEDSKTAYHTGLRLGAGVEHFVSDHFSVKLEYLNNNYFDVETLNATYTYTSGIPSITAEQSISDKIHAYNNSIMLGLNYHF
jgi:opacity protein-like surface antigen